MAFRVTAGELRHVVTVEQRSTARNADGSLVNSWSTVATIRCKIWAKSGKENEQSKKETGTMPVRFFARYVSGITTGQRLVFGSRYFDIITVVNVGELNRELDITADETT